MSKTETVEKVKSKPKVDLCPKWALERQCFTDAKIIDMKTGKQHSWPYKSSDIAAETAYNQFLEKITDPDTGYFYPKRDEDGKPVKTTPDNIPKYVIRTIIRVKLQQDNREVLLSKREWHGWDALGDPVSHYVPWPEMWNKTNFIYEKDWDPKRKSIVKNCKGPGFVENVYSMKFNEANLKELFDKRKDDNIQFIVKEQQTGTPRIVTAGPNINDTFKLFLKPFEYLYNAEYIP